LEEDIFPKVVAWLNGEFIQLAEAQILIFRLGF